MSNFGSFFACDDLDNVEPAGPLVPTATAQEGQCRARDLTLLERRDRLGRNTVAVAAPRLDLDENDAFPVYGDQIDLATA